jgi:hypothetical protein
VNNAIIYEENPTAVEEYAQIYATQQAGSIAVINIQQETDFNQFKQKKMQMHGML